MYNGKYYNLFEYLYRNHKEVSKCTLSFIEIENILGFKLPNSAYKYPAWWANEKQGSHIHARSWLTAGWSTSDVKIGDKVTFVRKVN